MNGWPGRHPVLADPELRRHAAAARAAVPDGRVVKLLRHVPGHRATTLVEAGGHRLVLKVDARPPVADPAEILRLLARCGLGDLTPYPRPVDGTGHVTAVTYHPGTVLHDLDDRHLVGACVRVGAALRRLHDCAADPGRRWTAADELDRSRSAAVAGTEPLLAALAADRPASDGEPVVSHRHLRPGHLVVDAGGSVRVLDLAAVARAPRGLDLGNLLAHLRRDALRGVRRPAAATAAADAFLLGYGRAPGVDEETLAWWTSVALVRLAGLAQLRRQDRVECDLVAAAAEQARRPGGLRLLAAAG